jgi:hypothetical protein
MMPPTPPEGGFVPVAEFEVDAVQARAAGFSLAGRGRDRAEYRLEMELDMPIDRQTRAVLGELLAQSEWRVWRKAPQPFRPTRPRRLTKPAP